MRARHILLLLAAFGALVPAPGRGTTLDQGSFKIYRHDQPLGAETFVFAEGNDSLTVEARQFLTIPTADGEQPLERAADVLLSRTDFSLRGFSSSRTFQGQTTGRGPAFSDTHYVAFRQNDRGGEAESRILPPGRIYVMDSQIITLFDIICRSFQDRAFKSRDINLLALGPSDTMLTAHATTLGTETIRWGEKPVVAHKLQLKVDSQTTFTFWIGPRGQLLRLIEPVGGLRAERATPAVKERTTSPEPPPKPGGSP